MRSTGQRCPAWIGAGWPLAAMCASKPRSRAGRGSCASRSRGPGARSGTRRRRAGRGTAASGPIMSTIPARVGSSSGESCSLARAATRCSGIPCPSAGDGALHALFAPVNRAAPGDLASAGRLGDGAVHGQVVQVQSDHLVVGGQRHAQQRPTVPGLGPRGQATADGAVRAARAGDAFVAAAVHQRGDHMVEHHPVGDPAAMTAPRDATGRTPDTPRPRSGRRTRPTAARSAMLVAEARTLQVIIGLQQSR